MGIPVIQEIFDGIRWGIDFFLNKAPKPLLYIIFLALILLFGSMIPFMLHIFGVHCDSNAEVLKTSPLMITKNFKIAIIDADELYNSSSYVPDEPNFATSCRKPSCFVDGEYYWESESECDNQTIIYPFLTTRLLSSRCSICQGGVNSTLIRGTGGNSQSFYLCFGDAYPIPKEDMNWYQSWTCDEDRCSPPVNYYYEYDTGTYDCSNLDVCGLNATETTYQIDEELASAGAELMYPFENRKDYRTFMYFKCDKQLKPQLTLYGIPLFDYKIWLILTVIGILLYILFKIK